MDAKSITEEDWEEILYALKIAFDDATINHEPHPEDQNKIFMKLIIKIESLKSKTTEPSKDSVSIPNSFVRMTQLVGDRKATPPIHGMLSVKKTTIWKWVKIGFFPKPIKLGNRITAWRLNEVQNFINRQGKT